MKKIRTIECGRCGNPVRSDGSKRYALGRTWIVCDYCGSWRRRWITVVIEKVEVEE